VVAKKFGARTGKKKAKKAAKKTGTGKKSQAWRAYVSGGISNSPLPP
jgi:hypothetical protein